MAAVEVRKVIQKDDGILWEALEDSIRESIKQNLLAMAIAEERYPICSPCSKLVRHSLAHVISVTAKNELQNERWGELVEVLYGLCSSPEIGKREV